MVQRDLRLLRESKADQTEHANNVTGMQRAIDDLRQDLGLLRETKAEQEEHASHAAMVQRDLAELRQELGQLRESKAEQSDHASHAVLVQSDIAELRQDLGQLRESKAEQSDHASHATTTQRVLTELRNSVAADKDGIHESLNSVHARMDTLAKEIANRGPPEDGASKLVPDLKALAQALEEEKLRRCEANADMHAYLRREHSEIITKFEMLLQELQESLSEESKDRRQEINALRMSANDGKKRRSDEDLEAEIARRIREFNEVKKAVEKERADRIAACDEIRGDLMKVHKLRQSGHDQGAEVEIPQAGQAGRPNPHAAEEADGTGLLSRMFRKRP